MVPREDPLKNGVHCKNETAGFGRFPGAMAHLYGSVLPLCVTAPEPGVGSSCWKPPQLLLLHFLPSLIWWHDHQIWWHGSLDISTGDILGQVGLCSGEGVQS